MGQCVLSCHRRTGGLETDSYRSQRERSPGNGEEREGFLEKGAFELSFEGWERLRQGEQGGGHLIGGPVWAKAC